MENVKVINPKKLMEDYFKGANPPRAAICELCKGIGVEADYYTASNPCKRCAGTCRVPCPVRELS
jgi:hypothetical protein